MILVLGVWTFLHTDDSEGKRARGYFASASRIRVSAEP